MKFLFNIFFLILLVTSPKLTFAQQPIKICSDSAKHPGGNVTIIQDEKIGNDIRPTVVTGDQPEMPGYRIQVFAGTDRAAAQKIKNELSAKYNVPTYLLYEAPYFKVRVGDYRSRIEAQSLFHELKQSYSGSLLVPGNINLPDLKQ